MGASWDNFIPFEHPEPITSVHFRGSHRLLQDGAQLLVDPVDCLNALGLQKPTVRGPDVPDRWRPLYEALCTEQTASDLAVQLGVDPGKVYAGLLELELLGLVRRTPGGLYRRLLS